MGNKSWIFWHALHDPSTRTGDLDRDELDALRNHIDERNERNQLRNQMRDQLRHQHEGMTNDESTNEDEANAGPIQGSACGETADNNETSPVSESDSPADDRDEGPTNDEPGHDEYYSCTKLSTTAG